MTLRPRLGPAPGLVLLAPFVGEFLLGNLTAGELGLGVVLAPLYGLGALLVRELGRRGGGWPAMVLLAAAYALGAVLVFWGNYAEERFLASPAQLAGIGVVIAALVVAAFRVRWRHLPRVQGSGPPAGLVGAAALAATSLWWGPAVLVTAGWYEWVEVAVWLPVAALGVPLVSRWSRQRGWDQRHRFALAAGATLTYVWVAFPLRPEGGGSRTVDLVSNLVFGAVAIVVLSLASRSAGRGEDAPGVLLGEELRG